jgi:ATP-dependent DNA helicase RecG
MRPPRLTPLFASAASLKGIGPKLGKVLAKLLRPGDPANAEARILDLLFHLPSGLIDRRERPRLDELPGKGIVTVEVTVGKHRPPPPHMKRLPYRVDCFDETGVLTLVFFHAFPDHLQRVLPPGELRFVSGAIDWFQGSPQIAHPDHIVSREEFAKLPLIEPVYPLTAGLSPRILGRAIRASLEKIPQLPEWQDEVWLKRKGWHDFAACLRELHQPQTQEHLSLVSKERLRLAYDELLANQLAVSLVRKHMKRKKGASWRAPAISGHASFHCCLIR